MNYGGFSWKRLFGISAFKSRVSRRIGIPLTASGRRRKLGASIFNLVGPLAGTLAVAAIAALTERHEPDGPTSSEPLSSLVGQVSDIQREVEEAAKKEGWQSTLVYFENAERGLYDVVLAEDTEHMGQMLQEGMAEVGFIGMQDAPRGIKFEFSLDDRFPTNDTVAERFVANAGEWIFAKSKELCAQQGMAAPVVHDFEFTVGEGAAQDTAPSKPGVTSFMFGLVLTTALVISLLLYQAWWAVGVVTAAALVAGVWHLSHSQAARVQKE